MSELGSPDLPRSASAHHARYAGALDSLLLHDEQIHDAVACTVGPFWVAIFGVLARPFYIRDAIVARTDRRLIIAYTKGRVEHLRVDRARARSAPLALARRAKYRTFRGRVACDLVWPNESRTMLAFAKKNAPVAERMLAGISFA